MTCRGGRGGPPPHRCDPATPWLSAEIGAGDTRPESGKTQEFPVDVVKKVVNRQTHKPLPVTQKPQRRTQGFTFVELMAVILILSVLAAVMIPRFMDATDEAHTSAINGVNGGFSTAVASARAQWLADGGAGSSVNFDGSNIPVSSLGWPTPVAGTTDCNDLWGGLMQNPPQVTTLAAPLVKGEGFWSFTVANPGISLCLYIYRPTYPERLMWIGYYGRHATLPQFNGRMIRSGF